MANTTKVDDTAHRFITMIKKPKVRQIAIGIAIIVIVLIIFAFMQSLQESGSRSESYKEVTGSAGFSAAIDYECKQSCDRKYDFNVFIFKDNGQQIGVVRPDKDGKVNMALAEGNYVMVIGKQFGNKMIFPQEPLSLKNGKSLELKLHYK
jgi:hypothetical protein